MVSEAELYRHLSQYLTEQRAALFDKVASRRTRHLCVVLEDIFQPHNASAVLRSCDCFGVQEVHIIENRNEYTVNPEVALGAAKWLDLHRYTHEENNTLPCLMSLRERGYQIVATSLSDESIPIEQVDLSTPSAIVFGTEMTGISDTVRQEADVHVKIPMRGFTESFNISVAAAICLYEWRSQLEASEINWELTDVQRLQLKTEWAMRSIKNGEEIAQSFAKEHG